MWLFAAFVAVPLIEITLFIQVGGLIGLWPTLAIVVITAVLGSWLVRQQGGRELARLRGSFATLNDPSEPLANGAMILFAGALLLTPGFFTDTIGFLLLIPPIRAAAFRWIRSRVKVASFTMGNPTDQTPRTGPVIDGDFEDVTGGPKPTHPPSGWTRH
jgi:UPF0716 protein FxsA